MKTKRQKQGARGTSTAKPLRAARGSAAADCEHSLARDAVLGGHYCIKCLLHFPYGCMWNEN